MPVVQVDSITKKYGSFTALDNVSFKVEQGDFFGCFGPNGAGKSTLLKIMTGQIQATGGSCSVLGLDPSASSIEVKKAIGIVPEVESPPSYLTASEFLQFVCSIRKVDDANKRIDHWMDFFDLSESKGTLCRDLSKGMRQKVMLSAAFIHEPKLLFLDEPFINLDPIYQRRLKDYLLALRDEGRTVFLCSHILETAQKLCHNVIILDHGHVALNSSIEAITSNGEDLETAFLRLVEVDHAKPT
jgi:ABC-2 type transport system ATP-binding protein